MACNIFYCLFFMYLFCRSIEMNFVLCKKLTKYKINPNPVMKDQYISNLFEHF